MSYEFIAGRQEDNTTACFVVCMWIELQLCGDQSVTDFEDNDMTGDDDNGHLWFTQWFLD